MPMLSIYGLISLKNDPDFNIFGDLVLPTQFADPTLITDRLLLDTMELEVLYADPDTFKGALGIYSKSRLDSWQKLADGMFHAYDPFINFTRDEARVNIITHDTQDERTDDLTHERTADLTEERTADLNEERTLDLADGNTRTTKVNAWDGSSANTMVTKEEVTDSGTNTGTDTLATTGTDTNTTTGTDTITDSGTSINKQTGTVKTEDYFHSQGDSAMYTPTDIAEKEWKLRASYSVAEYIIADIKTHFCLMVY